MLIHLTSPLPTGLHRIVPSARWYDIAMFASCFVELVMEGFNGLFVGVRPSPLPPSPPLPSSASRRRGVPASQAVIPDNKQSIINVFPSIPIFIPYSEETPFGWVKSDHLKQNSSLHRQALVLRGIFLK